MVKYLLARFVVTSIFILFCIFLIFNFFYIKNNFLKIKKYIILIYLVTLYIVLNGVGESWPAGGWLRARSWMGFQSGTSLNHLGRSLFTVHNRRLWFVDWLGGKGDKFGEAWMNRKKKDARCWSTGYVYFNKFAVNLLLQTQKKSSNFYLDI
jgi:hypothetical protein